MKNQKIPHIPILLSLLSFFSLSLSQSQTSPVSSIECSFVRSYQCFGATQRVHGHFYADLTANRVCYDYEEPFHYRFIITDSLLYGIDKKKNYGYAVLVKNATKKEAELIRSIHLFAPYLRCLQNERTVKASLDTLIYYEISGTLGFDMLVAQRETGFFQCIESFDLFGAMYQQTKCVFKSNNSEQVFPVLCSIRKKQGDKIDTTDLVVSNTRKNTRLKQDIFSIPQTCRIADKKPGLEPFFP
jgi:hypothetical protein